MAINNAPIVSIFDERSNAEHAIEGLHNAGIPSDRISYSGGSTNAANSGGLLENIKGMFTGAHDRTSDDVLNDLNRMGVPQDEAQYYAQQYKAGRTIVTIQADNLSQDALVILRNNGGYDYQGNWNRASSGKFTQTAGAGTMSDSPARSQSVNQPTASTNDPMGTSSNAATSPARNAAGTEAGTYNQDTNAPAFTSQRRYPNPADVSRANDQNVDNPDNKVNTYNQGATMPNEAGQQAYVDPNRQRSNVPNQQGFNVPSSQGLNDPNRQTPNQQGFNVPSSQGSNMPNQQGPNMPNQQGFNIPGPQGSNMPNQQGPNTPNQQASNMPNQQGLNDPNQQGLNNPNVNNPNKQAYTDPATYTQGVDNPSATNRQAYTDPTQSGNAYNQGVNAPQNQPDNPNFRGVRPERNQVNRDADQDYEREQRNTTDQNPS